MSNQGLWVGVGLVGLVVAASASGQRGDGEREATHELVVTGVPEVVIENSTDGITTVRAVDGDRVRVRTAVVGGDVEDVEIRVRQDGDRISVEATHPPGVRWFAWGPGPRVDVEVEAPRSSELSARIDDGPLTVSGFEGALDLAVDDGDLSVSDVSGALSARGDDGDLVLTGVDGEATIAIDDGDLRLDGVLTRLRVTTDDGDLDIRARPGSRMEDDWSIRLDDGDLDLALPEGFVATLRLETDNGATEVTHPFLVRGEVSDHRLYGTLHGGGHQLRITGDDGRVRVTQ